MMFLSATIHRMFSVVVLLFIVLGSSVAIQEAVPVVPSPVDEADLTQQSDMDSDSDIAAVEYEFLKRLQDNNVGKRAYSYVSEYKRLPVYNFGLGKRSPAPQLYGFGLGKRGGGNSHLYSFGLGKRDFDDDYNEEEIDEDVNSVEEEPTDDVMAEKRNRLYSFGLGKRVNPYSFGLGKRAPSSNQRLYNFGMGKRANPSMYSFGLGKRADSRLYSFGLGKRPSSNRNTRFSFGLGKRSGEAYSDDALDEGKRYGADHRFSFGLGKREVSVNELEEMTKMPTKEHQTQGHTVAKRSLYYGLGVGKRSSHNGSGHEDELQVNVNEEDMSRFARRPYAFGLGKRIPMYDFGVGKRAEH